jgi:hypothetical protein
MGRGQNTVRLAPSCAYYGGLLHFGSNTYGSLLAYHKAFAMGGLDLRRYSTARITTFHNLRTEGKG